MSARLEPTSLQTVQQTGQNSAASTATRLGSVLLRDPAARMYILTRLVAAFDEADQRHLTDLLGCGFTPDLIDKLRSMSMVDALRFTAGQCGLAIHVDGDAVRQQLGHLDRVRADRQMYESFIRAGASPHLTSRLFGVSDTDVRRLRKMIAPEIAAGGRPRTPAEDDRIQILQTWQRICLAEHSDRQRMWLLHLEFAELPIAALESVIATATAQAQMQTQTQSSANARHSH
jgi:hypothetical protein